MHRMIPAMAIMLGAAMGGGMPSGSGSVSMHAPAPNVAPGDIPNNGNKVARMAEAIMGGRSRRRGVASSSLNGRPDTGIARAKRAARKRRNQISNKEAHR